MNCKELTQKITEARAIAAEVGKIDPAESKEQLERCLDLWKSFENIMIDAEHAESYQYHIRERIAKKFGFDFTRSLSGEVFCGEKKINDDFKYYLVDREGKAIIAGPFLHLDDGGAENFLVYDKVLRNEKSVIEYKLINKNGALVRGLGVEGQIHLPDGEFENGQPLPIVHFGTDGSSLRTFLRSDGKILFEKKSFGLFNQTFSEGFVWARSLEGNYVLYNDQEEEVARCEDASIDFVHPIEDGKSLALKNTIFGYKVFAIDTKGQIEKTGQCVSKPVVNRYGDIIAGKNEEGRDFYFTLDGKRITVPIRDGWDCINPKEKLIKVNAPSVVRPNGVKFVDYDNNPINNLIFREAGKFSEGLVAVRLRNGTCGFMDEDGYLISLKTKNITDLSAICDGRARARDRGGYFLVDRFGNDLLNGKRFDWINGRATDGIYPAKNNNEEFFVKLNGDRIF